MGSRNAVTVFSGREHVVSHQSLRSIELFGDHIGERGRDAWPQPFLREYFDVLDYVLASGENFALHVEGGVVWAMVLEDGSGVALCFEPSRHPSARRAAHSQLALAG